MLVRAVYWRFEYWKPFAKEEDWAEGGWKHGRAGMTSGGFCSQGCDDLFQKCQRVLLMHVVGRSAKSLSWSALDSSDVDQWIIIFARSNFLSIWQAVITRQPTNTILYMERLVSEELPKYRVTHRTVAPRPWYFEKLLDEWVVEQMLTALLLELLLQSFTGREDDFTFNLIKALFQRPVNVFSPLCLGQCWGDVWPKRGFCAPKWNKHWFVRVFVRVWFDCINLYLMKMLVVVVGEVSSSSLSLNMSKICLFPYYMGTDAVYGRVSAEVQLIDSLESWLTNWGNIVHGRIFSVKYLLVELGT